MTLKRFCDLVGWKRLRRWREVIERIIEMDDGRPKHGGSTCAEIDNDLNNELNENHRLRGELDRMVTSQSERHQELLDRESAIEKLESDTRSRLRKETEQARAEVDRIKAEYLDTVKQNYQSLTLEPIQTDNRVGLGSGGYIIERTWHVPRLDGRYLLYKHRIDGPAAQDISSDSKVLRESWSVFNARHRIDGPAYIDYETGHKQYCLDGMEMSKETWQDEVERRTGVRPD